MTFDPNSRSDTLTRMLGELSPYPTREGKAVFLTGIDTGLMIGLRHPRLAEAMMNAIRTSRLSVTDTTEEQRDDEETQFIKQMSDLFEVKGSATS